MTTAQKKAAPEQGRHNNACPDYTTEFCHALLDANIHLAAGVQIIADSVLHRVRAVDDKPGQVSIWYVFHPDAPASGAAGNWRTSARLRWCSKGTSALTSAERAIIRERIEQDRKQHEAEKLARYRNAAIQAAKVWAESVPAKPSHPYLVKKAIEPGVSRQYGNVLVLPVVDFDGVIHGLQYIDPQGGKRFLPGMSKREHFIPVGGIPDGTRPLWIAEGFATASTLAALKPDAHHIAALDCGNLASVSTAARAKWPTLQIVVVPDFDTIGQAKAHEAAISARCAILPVPDVLPPGCSDWNDIQAARRQGVRHV